MKGIAGARHERNAALLRFWRRAITPHAALATNHRMDGLRRVFDHPRLLADDSSVCRALARAASLAISSIAIYGPVARVGGDVGRGRAGHAALARRPAVSSGLGVGGGSSAVRLRTVCLFAIRKEF